MPFILSFVIAYVIVYLLIPTFRKLAFKIDFLDKPRENVERKIHREPIALTASYPIFIGFIVSYFVMTRDFSIQAGAITLGALMLIGIGTIDDWYKTKGKDFPVLPKLLVQLVPGVLVFFSGIAFKGFFNPFNSEYILFPVWLQLFLTVLWVFGVTTVVNFTDGMDGLAAGISTISASTLFIVAILTNQNNSAVMAAAIVGVALAYLKYNRPPAKIFMGDAGATFIGFIISVISLDGVFKQATILSMGIPILALGVPIFDNIYVVIKRILRKQPFYQADASQAHYRLLKLGLSQLQVLTFLCLISICLGLSSIIIALVQK
ncbi:MAG: UDP-phosphate N-acetylgalactosaminyl-phosphate transferase [Paenibacillaceae bacterium]|jgi:UDP-N-acetylmuramyl pentapeptide phosphotransferase/UDP-N-acetylglucosamine-1-phosphate transferase|nr:UDP-phosphate N-acetylgalactosaminyl-phosphate transferase [Paenibacillaceae bacterium]